MDTTGGPEPEDVMVNCHLALVRLAQLALHITKPETRGIVVAPYIVSCEGAVNSSSQCTWHSPDPPEKRPLTLASIAASLLLLYISQPCSAANKSLRRTALCRAADGHKAEPAS